MGNICCVIITYNCDNDFIKTFDSVKDQVDKIVIVDNGSKKDTVDILNRLKSENDIELFLLPKNLGIAAAQNVGVKYALDNNYEWIMTLDHDSKLDKNMVSEMVKAWKNLSEEEQKKTLSIFPHYIEANLDIDSQLSEDNNYIKEVESGIASGNLVNREIFKKVGLFDEKLFIDCVDYDICFRIEKAGYKMIEVGRAYLFHTLGEIEIRKLLFKNFRCTNHSPLRRYYATRNRFYCWEKYKNKNSEFIKKDKTIFKNDVIKIILLEKDKAKKLKMIYRGYKDYKKNNFGKYKERG